MAVNVVTVSIEIDHLDRASLFEVSIDRPEKDVGRGGHEPPGPGGCLQNLLMS